MTETTTTFAETFAKDPNLLTQKDGVDAFGFYVEMIRFSDYNGSLENYVRAFVLENSFSVYQRQTGKKAGRWQVVYLDSHDTARDRLLKLMERLEHTGYTVQVRGEPMLVQATVADLVAVRKKDRRGPDCRWRAGAALDAKYGKVTDETKKGA